MQFHKSKTIPENSFIGQDFESIDYIDAFTIRLKSNETLGELNRKIFSSQKWVLALMGIRNSIVKPFGMKTGRNERINRIAEIEIGKKKNHTSSLPPPFTNENPILNPWVEPYSDLEIPYEGGGFSCPFCSIIADLDKLLLQDEKFYHNSIVSCH